MKTQIRYFPATKMQIIVKLNYIMILLRYAHRDMLECSAKSVITQVEFGEKDMEGSIPSNAKNVKNLTLF